MGTPSLKAPSAATDLRPIHVTATTSPGTTLHTSVTGTTDFDVVKIIATNNDTADRTLYLQLGGTSSSDLRKVGLAPGIPTTVVDCEHFHNGTIIKAYASVTDVISCKVSVVLDDN